MRKHRYMEYILNKTNGIELLANMSTQIKLMDNLYTMLIHLMNGRHIRIEVNLRYAFRIEPQTLVLVQREFAYCTLVAHNIK